MRLSLSIIILGCTLSLATAAEPAPPDAETGFVPIFNGKDLSGWVGIDGDTSSYYVKDSLLICKATGKVHIFTDKEFANFVFRLQIKLDPGGNNGVGIRGRSARSRTSTGWKSRCWTTNTTPTATRST